MGCGGSKIDNQPLVILCKERKELIKSASYHRSALAAAHLVYFQSLSDVGEAIKRFVDDEIVISGGGSSSSSSPDSPVLTLPSDEGKSKKKHKNSFPPLSSTSISHSIIEEEEDEDEEDDDSHLHLSSGSESEPEPGSGSGNHIRIENTPEQERQNRLPETFTFNPGYPINYTPPGYPPGYPSGQPPGYPSGQPPGYPSGQPPGYPPGYLPGYQYPVGGGWGYTGENPNMNRGMYFMKKSAPQSRPLIFQPESYHRVEPSDSGFTGERRSPPTPAPPSPPNVSAWDFLNVFDTYDYGNARSQVMASISSSPDSKEVREREGIPELEEESDQEIVIKQVYQRPKRRVLEKVKEEPKQPKIRVPESSSSFDSETVSSFSGSSDVESEFHYVSGEGKSSESSSKSLGELEDSSFEMSSLSSLSIHATREIGEVVKEIKSEFEIASSCGKEVALLLEVSKLPYQHKNHSFKVILSRIMYLVAPASRSAHSRPGRPIRVTSRTRRMAKTYVGQDVNGGFSGSLSSTLEKLYAWEKKLYKEVKYEERLRAIYEEKCKSLKKMDSHGAESSKIDATRAYIRKLLTKIDISIRSVDSISSRIHKLRDEELQPQLTQLIHGLIRMWRSMLKCHQKQFHAIMESKVRSVKANIQKDSGSRAVLDLEMELREWCNSFNNWVSTQKLYVQSLSGWLSRCLHYEPESTEDGIVPFSPSRIGAPPIFIICKDWQKAMGRISGESVSSAMQVFALSLHELWEKQEEEERRVRAEFEHQDAESDKRSMVSKGRSEISALDDLKVDLDSMRKKLVEERGRRNKTIKLVNSESSSSLKTGLVPIFQALRKFTAEVVKAHEIVRLHHPQ